ncbi:hypothetical protein FOZ62_024364, partial [Perkinsus olseni]
RSEEDTTDCKESSKQDKVNLTVATRIALSLCALCGMNMDPSGVEATGERIFCPEQIQIPQQLHEVLKDLTKEVVRSNPVGPEKVSEKEAQVRIYKFAIKFCQQKLEAISGQAAAPSESNAGVRNLNKKLREVRSMRNKIESGELREELLTDSQRAKLAREQDLLEQIEALQHAEAESCSSNEPQSVEEEEAHGLQPNGVESEQKTTTSMENESADEPTPGQTRRVKIRSIKKKLHDIAKLVEASENGKALTEQQRQKIARRPELEAQLEALHKEAEAGAGSAASAAADVSSSADDRAPQVNDTTPNEATKGDDDDVDDEGGEWIPSDRKVRRAMKRKTSFEIGRSTLSEKVCRVIRQPPDGSCLFHALGYWLNKPQHVIRRQLSGFLRHNASTVKLNGLTLEEWIKAESNSRTLEHYCNNLLRDNTWGGEIELVATSMVYNCDVYVWQHEDAPKSQTGKYVLCYKFHAPPVTRDVPPRRNNDKRDAEEPVTCHILFDGRKHYNVGC